MDWIADNILWLLLGGWVLSLLLVGRALLVLWRWLRPKLDPASRSWLKLIGSLLMLAVGGLVLLVTSSGLVAMGPGLLAQRRMLGDTAPDLVYTRVADGAAASLADHEGSVILVNQWATWCPPCRQEMPDLDRLQKSYGERGLVIVHISDESTETLASYLAEHPMSTEHGQAAPLPWPDTGRPTTFLLDREGVVREVVLGSRSYEHFEAMVTPYL
jgi:thiol-disulfide isomerase/thioredoxin